MKTDLNQMTKEQFFANYEFKDQHIDGFQEPLTEDQIIELIGAYHKHVVETEKNPYRKNTQYVEWAAVENVFDILIRKQS